MPSILSEKRQRISSWSPLCHSPRLCQPFISHITHVTVLLQFTQRHHTPALSNSFCHMVPNCQPRQIASHGNVWQILRTNHPSVPDVFIFFFQPFSFSPLLALTFIFLAFFPIFQALRYFGIDCSLNRHSRKDVTGTFGS